jgi:hypothetical protein
MDKRYTLVCERCGSDSVNSYVSAYWDVEKQDWEMGDSCDDDYCSSCGCETHLIELYSTGEEYPVGTKKAVMVKELSEDGATHGYTIITDETDQIYVVELANKESQSAEEIFSPKSIYILEKRDEFHWRYEA